MRDKNDNEIKEKISHANKDDDDDLLWRMNDITCILYCELDCSTLSLVCFLFVFFNEVVTPIIYIYWRSDFLLA